MGSDRSGKIVQIREYVDASRARTAALRSSLAARAGGFDDVFMELSSAHEELRVSEEELQDQALRHATANAALQREVGDLRALFDHAIDGQAETDLHGVLRVANHPLAEMLGIEPRFLQGKPLINFVSRGDCPAFRTALGMAGQGELRPVVLWLRPRRGGAPFIAELRARAVGSGSAEGRRAISWTIRRVSPSFDRDEEGGEIGIAALVEAAVLSVSDGAAVRNVRLDRSGLVADVRAPRDVAARALPAFEDAARAGLRLTRNGETFGVAAAVEGEQLLLQFGPASLRLPIAVLTSAGKSNARKP